MLKLSVDSLVLPHLQYALIVWGPLLSQGSITSYRLQRLQNWRVRIVQSFCKYDHVSHHLKLLSWLPMTQQIQYRSIIICAMYYHHVIPFIAPLRFGRQHTRDTRHSDNFANISRFWLSSTQGFFHHRSTERWNILQEIILTLSYGEFAPAVAISAWWKKMASVVDYLFCDCYIIASYFSLCT